MFMNKELLSYLLTYLLFRTQIMDTVSDEDLYAVNFVAELLCLQDQSYTVTNE